MKVLVLGGKGMAGHMVVDYLIRSTDYEVEYTHRNSEEQNGIYLNASNFKAMDQVISCFKPNVIVNCIGILNEKASEKRMEAIIVNSFLPHYLSQKLSETGGKLIHISTDCVFSGKDGNYTENSTTDGNTIYAKTKALGEVTGKPHLTIRTSIIGPELKNGIGLFHWFMKQSGQVNGFVNVLWNGVTTLELAKIIHKVIEEDVYGLYHLTAAEIISKHNLLSKIKEAFSKEEITIHPVDVPVCDRTLENTRDDVRFVTPQYDEMLVELRDWINENEWR
ncbi:SDR family oxidoreductase [Alkalihalobacillus sp. AL-G]|uniref:dTDP-4-dehydrorhamnose reductase family protein n=1 Tax=Alkalihalobacillus sp. AL-G TaxID=2926399 RepID=UPI00272DC46F|nr:SDR family oxidoreductase [Alkalihalobacillus sp. AL-G]WLD94954.1 SDR family oxidoreductase [Alkalihalobacillus sp. AL-G]